MNAKQCKLARTLLGWSGRELSHQAKVGLRAIREFEAGKRNIHPRTNRKIRATFVINGIEFLDDQGGLGVRKKPGLEEYLISESSNIQLKRPYVTKLQVSLSLPYDLIAPYKIS